MSEKFIMCVNCGELSPHVFVKTEHRKYQYHSRKEGCEKDGSGLKEIWQCKVCMATRIYGAPSEEEAPGYWTMKNEKAHVVSVIKNFHNSRAVLFCATPEEWLSGYLRGLDRRYYGFNGKPMSKLDRNELKMFALSEQKKLLVRQGK